MNLYFYELKSSWKSMLIWIACIIGFYVFSMSMFPSFSKNVSSMDEMLANFSPEMMKALGMDIIDFSKPMDYMSYIFQYMLVAVGSLAILMGSGIIAKEEADRTIEFLYAKPISRRTIVLSKMSAAITNILFMTAAFYISTLITMIIVDDNIDYAAIFRVSVGMGLFMLCFLSMGLFIGHFIIKSSKRLPISLGLLFLFYLTTIMSDINDQMSFLRWISPYEYFNGVALIHDGYSLPYLIITFIVLILGFGITGYLYQNKDLNG